MKWGRRGGSRGCSIAPLWLDPMDVHIELEALEHRYEAPYAEGLVSLLGEVDIPERQARGLYAIDWRSANNLIVYGASGVGTDDVVATALYSLASRYGTDDFYFYVIDCEPGILSAFAPCRNAAGWFGPTTPSAWKISLSCLRRREPSS